MKARRIVFTAPGEVKVEPFEVASPGPGEILVETLYTVISPGTERAHLLATVNTVTRDKGFPFYPGYSNVGRVLEVGSDVTGVRVGQAVATAQPHLSHFLHPVTDAARAKSKPMVPPEASFGGARAFWPLPELDAQKLKECATHCFSGVALHGVRRARIELGEAVVVLGLGPIGLQCAQYSRLFGGFPVIGIDPSPIRRKIAHDVGIDGAYADAAELAAVLAQGPAVVIEATGLPDVIPAAFKICGRNGRVILLGSTRGLTDGVNFYTDVHKKGLEIIGVHASTRPPNDSKPHHWTSRDEIALILRLIGAGRVKCGPLITHEVAADRAAEGYGIVRESPEAIVVALKWAS